MKKLIALLLVVLMIFSFTACGGKDPNLGKYNAVSSSMIGTENDWIELKKGGKGTFFSAFEFDMKWKLEGEKFTGTVTFLGMEETLEGTLKDGVLTASYGDISYVFVKEGVEAPVENTAPETPSAPEADPEAAPEAAPAQGEFFTTPTSWNGWIMKGDEMLDAVATLDIDPATNKMYFDVYFDTDNTNAFYSAFVENNEDRSLVPVIGTEDAWVDDTFMAAGDEYTYGFYRNYDDGIVCTATIADYDMMMYFKKADAEWNPSAEMLPPDQSDIKIAGQAAPEATEPEAEEPEATEPEAAEPAVTGEMFNAGNVSAVVPDGWKAFPVADIFAEEDDAVDPNAIQIGKGAESDWDLYSVPYLDIDYYGPSSELWPPTKDWYDDAEDIAPFKAGKYNWEGFSATSFGQPLTIVWAIDGDDEYQVNIWTGADANNAITVMDADVQAILASLQPTA
ncbi:MAG: hypothetical protein IKK29_07725 [Christensenellaceae bacterium]|nr:hypothetical protein [Christensenellaceae bacterium]